jgi:hypothetical protein
VIPVASNRRGLELQQGSGYPGPVCPITLERYEMSPNFSRPASASPLWQSAGWLCLFQPYSSRLARAPICSFSPISPPPSRHYDSTFITDDERTRLIAMFETSRAEEHVAAVKTRQEHRGE